MSDFQSEMEKYSTQTDDMLDELRYDDLLFRFRIMLHFIIFLFIINIATIFLIVILLKKHV